MERIENRIVATFRDGNFIVEITDDGDSWGTWIYLPDYAVKQFAFGSAKVQGGYEFTVEDHIDTVMTAGLSLEEAEYITEYVED